MLLKNIRGQENAKNFIETVLSLDKAGHAYIFLGPEGVGKHKTAIEFAKLLNCTVRENNTNCMCLSCAKIDKGIHPDVFFIKKTSGSQNIPIEDIRVLSARFALKSFESRFKIAVIDAGYLTQEASNALLKILEEPGPDIIFILIAATTKSVSDTIISRCQKVRFSPLSSHDFAAILNEDFNIPGEEAAFLFALSGGNITKALILKEKGAMEWKNMVVDGFMKGSVATSFNLDSDLDKSDQEAACDILFGFCRDIIIYKHTKDNNLLINADRSKYISELAEATDQCRIEFWISCIEQAKLHIKANVNPRLTINALKENLGPVQDQAID
jgi:DNA polymerase III subunit delta'